MREVPDDEHDAWVQAMRERARQDVEAMVPQPGHPVYGIAAPTLTPAALQGYSLTDGESTSVTLAYGPEASQDGPYAEVITAVADAFAGPAAGSTTTDGEPGEASLRLAVERERDRPLAWADDPEAGPYPEPDELPDEPPAVVSRETLPAGDAVVCRSGTVWAARLVPADAAGAVVVTIIGRGLAPESVLLERVTDLGPMVEARNQIIAARIERARQRPKPPPPELAPAQGAAALRALAEHTLAEHREMHPARGGAARDRARRRRPDQGSGRLRSALWKRAVAEHQRLRGTDQYAADYAVTTAINHLGFLLENAPWFDADPRLRAAAIDETCRHAMLAEIVPSQPAQDAWARYWAGRQTWLPPDGEPADVLAAMAAREALTDDCLRAWAEWADNA